MSALPNNVPIETDWLKRWAHYSPNKIALNCCNTGRALNYADFFQQSKSLSQSLARHYGVKKGDRVAALAMNCLEYIVLFYALQRLGAILVPINYRLRPREISHILADSTARLLVIDEEFEGVYKEIPEGIRPPFVVYMRGAERSVESMISEISLAALESDDFAADFEDAAMILYTSGTTGSPKGAVLTHKGLFWNAVNTGLRLQLNQNDRTVIFLPFFHTGGWNVLTTPFFFFGGTIDLLNKFEPETVLNVCEKYRHTILFGVPTTMEMMAQVPRFQTVNLESIRYAIVGGEPMSLQAIMTWNQKGIPIRQGFGLTEFGPNVFSLNEEDAIRKIGSIGFPNFYVEAQIVDDNNQPVLDGEVGELILRGPVCMREYWNNPKATQETIVDGWLKTGDLVRRDHEGYFYVAGRKKEMYISGGENVYPVEVEQVLRRVPGVIEAAVIGIKDEKWGEVGKAFVVAAKTVTEEELREHCQKNLAKFKIPKSFVFMPSLPKGDSGKILKRELQSTI